MKKGTTATVSYSFRFWGDYSETKRRTERVNAVEHYELIRRKHFVDGMSGRVIAEEFGILASSSRRHLSIRSRPAFGFRCVRSERPLERCPHMGINVNSVLSPRDTAL